MRGQEVGVSVWEDKGEGTRGWGVGLGGQR